MKKMFIIMIIVISQLAVTNAATVNWWNITNNWWNINIHWEDTLVDWNVTSNWETIDIENDRCKSNPSLCMIDGMDWEPIELNSASETNLVASSTWNWYVKELPTTWPKEIFIFILSMIVAFFIITARKQKV